MIIYFEETAAHIGTMTDEEFKDFIELLVNTGYSEEEIDNLIERGTQQFLENLGG